jgi:dCMP deaminase
MTRKELKDQSFLDMAVAQSKLSRDGSTKVGCVLVDTEGCVISTGYNGAPMGIDDSRIDFSGKPFEAIFEKPPVIKLDLEKGSDKRFVDNRSFMTTKNSYMIHSELSALLLTDNRSRLKGATAYITHYPCNNCSLALAQSGIKKIHVLDNRTKSFGSYIKESLYILELSGIELIVH